MHFARVSAPSLPGLIHSSAFKFAVCEYNGLSGSEFDRSVLRVTPCTRSASLPSLLRIARWHAKSVTSGKRAARRTDESMCVGSLMFDLTSEDTRVASLIHLREALAEPSSIQLSEFYRDKKNI